MVYLVKPSTAYLDRISKFKAAFFMAEESRIPGSGGLEKYDELERWMASLDLLESGMIEGTVPTSVFLIVTDTDDVVGTISLRRHLTKDLEEFGGHVGYAITSSERNKGYAKNALETLIRTKAIQHTDLWIMCEDDNIPSNIVVIDNQGILMNQINHHGKVINRYKITI